MMYREEEQLQRCCVNQFKWRYSRYFRLLTHPANEGTADPKRGARLKAMGVQAGVPDLLLFVARGGYHGLAIEMKSRKGKLEKVQKEYLGMLEEQGWKTAVCRSLEEFLDIIHEYLGPEEDPDRETLLKLLNA